MTFTEEEEVACRGLLKMALGEDLGAAGDLTTQAVIPPQLRGDACFRTRVPAVISGLSAASLVFREIDPSLEFRGLCEDGASAGPGSEIARVSGRMASILAGERIALNFLQHLSGIATRTRAYVDRVADTGCQILDTRKTLPGWRALEKYAVRCGGGHNHRFGLHDAVLIKDNHLAAMRDAVDPVGHAVLAARRRFGHSVGITVEVDSIAQLEAALAAAPDIILLDNMGPEMLCMAVRRRNEVAPSVLLEASGGITLETVRDIAGTGVDRISIGDLTHSAPAIDIGLDYEIS
jgi:nicotinate-nucleotide pyrophosphorylase (carboxylating)